MLAMDSHGGHIGNLGLACRCRGDPRLLVESAKLAERSGFSGVWLVEVQETDVLALAGALSQNTEQITIGTGVVNLSLRLPTLLAMSAVTLAELSKGRFILGVGAGYPPMGYKRKNEFDTSLNRLSESLQIVRGCLSASNSGKSFDFAGRLYEVRGFKPGLSSEHRIPIYAAAMGEKTVEVAAKYADGVIMMIPTLEHVRKLISVIDYNLGKRGMSRQKPGGESAPDDFVVACYFVTVVSDDPEEAEKFARRTVVNYTSSSAYHENFIRLGFSKEVEDIDKARASGADFDTLATLVSKEMAEATIVYGDAEQCLKRISEFERIGITHPIVYPSTAGPLPFPKEVNHAIEEFAPFLAS